LLALFPGLSALVSLYGLFADPRAVTKLSGYLGGVAPGGGLSMLAGEVKRLASVSRRALGAAFFVSLAMSLWSANGGGMALIGALNTANQVTETRSYPRCVALSMALTLGGLAVAALGITVIVAAPPLLAALGLPRLAQLAFLRWPVMLIVATLMCATLYRFGPCRPSPSGRWITPGAVLATLAWLAISALFSWYVRNFNNYEKTYGSLGAIVGFLTWVWLSLMIMLFGAELDREIERAA
jgi:membrane protein